MSCHNGHRERLRAKFQKQKDILEDHELLELLLCYSIPRRNTNDIAHALLAEFGSFGQILDADETMLRRVKGVGPNTVMQIKAMAELMARATRSRADERRLLSSRAELNLYLSSLFIGCSREKIFLLLFNAAGRLLLCEQLDEGNILGAELDIRQLIDLCLRHNAACAVLAHNHPDGFPAPSADDILATETVKRALDQIGIRLADHFIVCQDRCISILQYQNKNKER